MRTFSLWLILIAGSILSAQDPASANQSSDLAKSLGITFSDSSQSTLVVVRDGKPYLIDVVAKTVRPMEGQVASNVSNGSNPGATIFQQACASCHGPDGRGIAKIGTPNFTDPKFQKSHTDEQILDAIHNGRAGGRMPAWSGKLTEPQISAVAAYVRSFAGGASTTQVAQTASLEQTQPSGVYQPGDDFLFSLPTGRPLEQGGWYVNFTHRFPYSAAASGAGRGEILFGLDDFAIPSFGVAYGVTDRFSVSIYRSPSLLGRPIQLMAAYNVLDEHRGAPLNLTLRASLEGQNDFRKNFTENLEAILSRSITSRAQILLVPTLSFNDRRLVQDGFRSADIADEPGVTAFSLGIGASVDIRPTVALLAEVIPTLLHGDGLGIHRPAYSLGIQKKIWRHAFTLGLTTSPGTTVSQRADTRAQLLNDPSADTPGGLFLGFDLTRQVH